MPKNCKEIKKKALNALSGSIFYESMVKGGVTELGIVFSHIGQKREGKPERKLPGHL